MEAVSADTSRKICEIPEQMVKIRMHNQCPRCGKETDQEFEVDSFVAQLLVGRSNSKNACAECSEIVRADQLAREIAINAQVALDESGIPAEFLNWDRELGNSKLANAIADNTDKCLFIQGGYGTGKSRAACANVKRQIQKGRSGKFVRFSDIANRYQRTFTNGETEPDRYIDNLLRIDILVIDDICKRRITQAAGELLFGILDRVYCGQSKCRVWMTSNIAVKDLANKFDSFDSGDAVVSRIDRMAKENKAAVITA